MNTFENPLQLILSLKGGACLAILWIMQYEKQPVGQEYLQVWSGYGQKPVEIALKRLVELNLVMRIDRYHWQLTAYAHQLPLMAELDKGSSKDSCSLPSTTTTIIEGQQVKVGSSRIKSRKDSYSVELLHDAGIGHPTCDRLAELPWMTVAYIQAHIQNARKNNIDTALLIYKMKMQDDPPTEEQRYDYAESARRLGMHVITG